MALRRVVAIEPSRDLCGTTPEQFGELLTRLAPAWEEMRRARAERPGRLRAPGAGPKPTALWVRLLVALTHLRQGTSVRATGRIFGVHERSVRRWRDEIEGLLAGHGCLPPGAVAPIRTTADLLAHLESRPDVPVLVDGTEVPRWTPGDWEAQQAAWSGKSKAHVLKGTVVADGSRRPLWFEANPSGEGRTHDTTMLRSQTALLLALLASGALIVGDQGYRGLRRDVGARAWVPDVKPRRGVRPARDTDHALVRMPVEHAIGRMKWWRAMRDWRRPVGSFDRTGKAVAALASML
jgi:DDE superfamily endonuclease/Helix-turn-helix of DDE superfamily endonuclease